MFPSNTRYRPSLTAFRYLRVYITANNGDATYTSIQEIEYSTTAGGSDITTTGMATGQSDYTTTDNSYFAKAIDNNFTTAGGGAYVSKDNTYPHWGTVDLGAGNAQLPVEFRMWCQNYSGGPQRAPKDFKVQGSNDNTAWTDIKAFTGVTTWTAGTGKTFSLT